MSLPPKEQPRDQAPTAESRVKQESAVNGNDGKSETDKVIPPNISAFFLDSAISPLVFFKLLKEKKIKRFSRDDEARAVELLAANDVDGGRLWALISQSSLPDAVEAWVWRAAQDRLHSFVGSDFDPEQDATKILSILCNSLSLRLNSKDKQEYRTAENWLRIGICWLMKKRSLQPWTVAESLLPVLFHENRRALEVSRRALQAGRSNEFRLAVAMASLARDMVRIAQSERNDERQRADHFRDQLEQARAENQDLKLKLVSTNADLEKTSAALLNAQNQLEADRQHWGHDLSETKARHRVLLSERVAPLISDAIDALEIEPQEPHIALRRIRTVLSLVQGGES